MLANKKREMETSMDMLLGKAAFWPSKKGQLEPEPVKGAGQ